MSKVLITPSILSADLGQLQKEVESIEASADWLQIDVMDGHFVSNLSFGAPVTKWIKTDLPLDIHLMVENPNERIQEFLDIGVHNITFHAEAVQKKQDQIDLIEVIRKGGATAGIAINPETSLDSIGGILEHIDLLLVMSVHPGFGGQKFIDHVLSSVQTARAAFPDLMIQMDGGINDSSAPKCIAAGANNLVAGSFIFGSKNRTLAIDSLRQPS